MCGIAGLIDVGTGLSGRSPVDRATRMAEGMRRRGPDSHGLWSDGPQRVVLAHRRLAILDLSAAGAQPMVSSDGRDVLVYNGELYNHPQLRDELEAEGAVFHSSSDTEVLLAALRAWGTGALRRFHGMFAFAWWHAPERRLVLARDHAGIKPLYYARDPNSDAFGFASTLEALLELPWVQRDDVCPDALRDLLLLGHVPAPAGFLTHTHQVRPGEVVVRRADGSLTSDFWWRPEADGLGGARRDVDLEAFEALLQRVVARHRLADVPLGSFLSGGVDSAVVTAVARRQTDAGFQTFTVANPGWSQDEGPAARQIAEALDVDAHVLEADPAGDAAAWDDVAGAQYEPFGDYSMLPSLQVCGAAKARVTVALSGDGGDELFFGYERPHTLLAAGRGFEVPYVLRRVRYLLARVGLLRPVPDALAHPSAGRFYRALNSRISRSWLARLAPTLAYDAAGGEIYAHEEVSAPDDLARAARAMEWDGQLQRCLKKLDMASMHHSLEVRVPLLDRELVEYAFSLAPDALIAGPQRKWPLRSVLARHMGAELPPSEKRGFSVPLAAWLRTSLRGTLQSLLCDGPLYPEGLLRPEAVRAYVDEHLRGEADHKWGLYALMSLQAWGRRMADR